MKAAAVNLELIKYKRVSDRRKKGSEFISKERSQSEVKKPFKWKLKNRPAFPPLTSPGLRQYGRYQETGIVIEIIEFKMKKRLINGLNCVWKFLMDKVVKTDKIMTRNSLIDKNQEYKDWV